MLAHVLPEVGLQVWQIHVLQNLPYFWIAKASCSVSPVEGQVHEQLTLINMIHFNEQRNAPLSYFKNCCLFQSIVGIEFVHGAVRTSLQRSSCFESNCFTRTPSLPCAIYS